MALMEVNFFSKALMRPVTMNVILPVDKVFFGEETEEENKPFKTGLRHLREIKITINRRNAGFFMSNFIYFYVVRSCILSLYVI